MSINNDDDRRKYLNNKTSNQLFITVDYIDAYKLTNFSQNAYLILCRTLKLFLLIPNNPHHAGMPFAWNERERKYVAIRKK